MFWADSSRAYCTRQIPSRRREERKKKKMKKKTEQDKKRRIRGERDEKHEGPSRTVAWDSRIIPWQTINYWHYVLECLLAPATNHRSVDLWPRSVRSILRCISLARTRAYARRRSGTMHARFPYPRIPASPPVRKNNNQSPLIIHTVDR